MKGKKKLRRPRQRWLDTVKADMRRRGQTTEDADV